MTELSPPEAFRPACFNATLEVAAETTSAVVVHGWLFSGKRWILHAWCEIGEDVVDLTADRAPIPRETYYSAMGATEARSIRYGRLEFFENMASSGHAGPFRRDLFFAETSDADPISRFAPETASGAESTHGQ
jgi:hypothetical protein